MKPWPAASRWRCRCEKSDVGRKKLCWSSPRVRRVRNKRRARETHACHQQGSKATQDWCHFCPAHHVQSKSLTQICFFPGSIAKGSSSKSGCQLHLPTSHANLSRVTSPAIFSCQPVESYFTCQLLMPTCRELLHLPTSHVNFLRVTSPANFSCQLFGCYLILLKAQANLSGVTSLS